MSDYQGNIIIKNPATPTGPAATGRAPGMWKLNEVAYWIKQGVWPNANIVPDPYFPYVTLLLSTTSLGNANNNLFVDSSGAFNPISRNGNATQGSFTPYATNWSNYFDGSGDYLSIPSSSSLNFGTGNWTIECWVYVSTRTTNYPLLFGNNRGAWTTDALALTLSNADSASYNDKFVFAWNNGGFSSPSAGTSQLLVANVTNNKGTWYHFAAVRNGTSVKMYRDGVEVASATVSAAATFSWGYNGSLIGGGNWDGASSYMDGYVSNLRVTSSAVYTAAFTPPTSPLTAISGTVYLTCQSNRFRDASTNNFTITRNGDTRVTDFGPFNPTYPGAVYNQSDITNWSGYFDGSGDWLASPSSSAFAFGTGDYTLEGWFYTGATGTERRILYFNDDRNNVDVTTSNTIIMYDGAVRTFGTIVANAWNHFAVSRASGTVRCYLNGVLGYSGSETSNTATRILNIGATPAGNGPFSGYISNIRIVKGTAVYTGASLTVPTSALTAISGTSLLTLQNAAFTDNSTNNLIITPSGNVTVNGNSPFNTVGYWSNYFDGTTGQYLNAPANAAFNFGTGDFTVEGWVYPTGTLGVPMPIVEVRTTGGANGFAFLRTASAQTLNVYTNGAFVGASTNSLTLNQWNHVALTRSGNTWTYWINGVSGGSFTNSSTQSDGATTGPKIGGSTTSGEVWVGYLSNIRIVKGTAVYTGAFTPPTTPLTAISGTSLLTCQNGRFIDNSTNAFTITVNGSPQVQSFDPFYTATVASNGGSMYFDGSGDFLNTATNFPPIGTGDFTAECWWYPVGTASQEFTYFSVGNVTTTSGFALATDPARGLFLYSGGYVNTSGVAMPVANAWNHIVFTRQSGSLRLYLNGSLRETVSWTNSISAAQVYIGRAANGYFGTPLGYMSNIRYSGTSLYSGSTYTVPTAPLTPSANTGLLVNGMNAGIYDSATINDMETVGDVKVRNFTPGNYYAGSFDGSGDYLSTGVVAALGLGTSDFTFECWVNPTAYPNDCFLVGIGSTPTGNEVSLQIRNGQVSSHLYISGSHSDVQFTDLPVTLNTWSHLAISRVSGVLYGFLNGVRSSVAPALTANFSTSALASVAAADRFAGSLSNARITKNSAVYSTATYTVPTSPLMPTTNTAFLTCQNTTFIDNSFNALPITVYGGATAGVAGPFTYTSGASAFFDGSGDYLAIRSTPELAFGTGDFTVEAWMYVTASSGDWFIISSIGSGGFFFGQRAGSGLGYGRTAVAWDYNSGVNPTVGAWQHIAISRSGTNIRIFLSGSQIGTTQSSSTDYTLATGGTSIGSQGANYYLNGALRDVRITKGIARYTSNFTPPTTAFPTY